MDEAMKGERVEMEAWDVYKCIKEQAWKEYLEATRPARDKLQAIQPWGWKEEAWDEYQKATRPAWDKLQALQVSAWEAFLRIMKAMDDRPS